MDVRVEDQGSIILLIPESESAEAWFGEHIDQDDSFQPYWPRAVVVEPRYADAILQGLFEEGFEIGV